MIRKWLASVRRQARDPEPPPSHLPQASSTQSEPSFAQEGEDRILAQWLPDISAGYYVDIGAHHPTRFSNTALLYEQGWRGLNVDPRPGAKALFDELRPRDTTVEVAVGKEAGQLEYFIFDDEALNTLSRDRAESLVATTHYRLVRSVLVSVITLAELLDTYLPKFQSIDLMNVDVEGLDMPVLASNDWSRFKPTHLVVEDLGFKRLDEAASATTVQFLGPLGYVPVAKTLRSVFFELAGGP
jgi:FkbM family methyltransferase